MEDRVTDRMIESNGSGRYRGLRLLVHRPSLLVASLPLAAYSILVFAFKVKESWVPEWDSALYLLTARSLAEGLGYTYLGKAFFLRPPGFSWLLSLFLRDGGFNFHLLNLLIVGFAVATVWVVFFVFRMRYGDWWALAIALLTGTSRLFVSGLNEVLADFPSVLLLYTGLGIFDRTLLRPRKVWIPTVAGALLLAGSAYMRTAALAAGPAVVIAYLLRGQGWRRLRGLIPFVVLMLLVAPWLYHASIEASKAERPSEQLLIFDYKTAVFHVDRGDPDSETLSPSMWLDRIKWNATRLVRNGIVGIVGIPGRWVSYALAAIVVFGFFVSLGRNPSTLDLFALFYVGVLLGYFLIAERLVIPLVPFVFAYIVESVRFAIRRAGERSTAVASLRWAAIAGAVFVIVLNLLPEPLASDAVAPKRTYYKGTTTQITQDERLVAEWLRLNTTAEATVLAGPAPILSVLADRTVYTFRFRPVEYVLGQHDIDFVVYSWWALARGEREVMSRARARWVLASSYPGESIRIYHLTSSGLLPEAPEGEPVEVLEREIERGVRLIGGRES